MNWLGVFAKYSRFQTALAPLIQNLFCTSSGATCNFMFLSCPISLSRFLATFCEKARFRSAPQVNLLSPIQVRGIATLWNTLKSTFSHEIAFARVDFLNLLKTLCRAGFHLARTLATNLLNSWKTLSLESLLLFGLGCFFASQLQL